jgi:hypothetical protein
MKRAYLVFAFVGAILLELILWHRWARSAQIKDYTPPDSWYFQNIGLVCIVLLLLAPVLRHGLTWQRIIAWILCAYPAIYMIAGFEYAFTELTQP